MPQQQYKAQLGAAHNDGNHMSKKIPGVDEAPGIIFQNGMEEPFLLCLRLLTAGEQNRISYIYAASP